MFLTENGRKISPWHDVPLHLQNPNEINIVIEIPKILNKKYKMNAEEEYNPIRFHAKEMAAICNYTSKYRNIFPQFNYGMIPLTWEDSSTLDSTTHLIGDDDPLDICELGQTEMEVASVCAVRILGAFCVKDKGQLDWKFLALNANEAQKHSISGAEDFNKLYPGRLQSVVKWFKNVKNEQNATQESIMLNESIINEKEALEVIRKAYTNYKQLINGEKRGKQRMWYRNHFLDPVS